MFLCDKCHNARRHLGLIRSLGACEGCGKRKVCIDCHMPDCKPKPRRPRKPSQAQRTTE